MPISLRLVRMGREASRVSCWEAWRSPLLATPNAPLKSFARQWVTDRVLLAETSRNNYGRAGICLQGKWTCRKGGDFALQNAQ